jgi:natural product precursor
MKSLKLNNLEYSSLNEKEMKHITGGASCYCACMYANSGGSSTDDNGIANNVNGLHSIGVPLDEQVVYISECIVEAPRP